jgi:hypothetical protein
MRLLCHFLRFQQVMNTTKSPREAWKDFPNPKRSSISLKRLLRIGCKRPLIRAIFLLKKKKRRPRMTCSPTSLETVRLR